MLSVRAGTTQPLYSHLAALPLESPRPPASRAQSGSLGAQPGELVGRERLSQGVEAHHAIDGLVLVRLGRFKLVLPISILFPCRLSLASLHDGYPSVKAYLELLYYFQCEEFQKRRQPTRMAEARPRQGKAKVRGRQSGTLNGVSHVG